MLTDASCLLSVCEPEFCESLMCHVASSSLPVTVRPGRERLSRQSHRQQQQKANRKLHQHYSINEVAARSQDSGKSSIKFGAPREASAHNVTVHAITDEDVTDGTTEFRR